jgi:hypothetical protein
VRKFSQHLNTHVFSVMLILTGILCSSVARAYEFDSDDFRVNGFGTLGYTQSDNTYFSSRNTTAQDGIFDEGTLSLDSRIGIQLDYSATDKLEFSAQFVAAKRAENSFNKSVHSAYLSYDLTPSLELRLGRQVSNFFMLSTYRDIGFVQLLAHPVTDFYGQTSTDYGDGISLYYTQPLFEGSLRTHVWFNKTTVSYYTTELTTLGLEPNYGVITTWESDAWSFNFMFSRVKFNDSNKNYQTLEGILNAVEPLWPESNGIAEHFTFNDDYANYYGLGVSYDAHDWVVRSEVSFIDTQSLFTDEVRSGYILLGHRFERLTPFIVASALKNKRAAIPNYSGNNPFVLELESNLNDLAHYFHQSQKTVSLGMRWDVKPKLALKAQIDRTWISAYGGGVTQQRALVNHTEVVNRFTLTMDFLF